MTRIIFVGGFLGAGKTTLLYEINKILLKRGLSTGLITNDQAPDLVDTSILESANLNITEVTGSCFCCDFKALRRAIEKVGKNTTTDIIIAEPVGSCTDLSATIINPIKDIMKTDLEVKPLTVLIDPSRLRDVLNTENTKLHPSAAYIIKKQLEESDVIVITKTDLYTREEIEEIRIKLSAGFPDCEIRTISSKTGEGIEEWLDSVLESKDAGKHIVDIDYDRYAEGEAVLGWLNSSVFLEGENVNWDDYAHRFMEELASEFDTANASVGHVKIIIENGDQYIAANLTGRSDTLTYRWSAGVSDTAEMIVNARVEMTPGDLEKLFTSVLKKITDNKIEAHINRIRSISPGYPNPTHRYRKN